MEKIETVTVEELVVEEQQKAPMLDAFFRIHDFLVAHSFMPIRRQLMDEINWDHRLIAIKGGRGVGKTDLVQKIRTYLKIDKYASTEMDNNSNSYEEMVTNNYVRQESKSIFDLLNQSYIIILHFNSACLITV